MVILNLIFWNAYVENQRVTSTPSQPQYATLWGYIQSDTFRAIMTTLIIPIFIFLFERRFKILENYENTIKEKKANKIKENRERRWNTISLTQAIWTKTYGLMTEVAYFDSKSGKIEKINTILQRLEGTTIEVQDVVNEWKHRFPNLSNEEVSVLVKPVGHILTISSTVAHLIKEEMRTKKSDIENLQISLIIIVDVIKAMYHHGTMNVLKESLEFLSLLEENLPHYAVTISSDSIDRLVSRLDSVEHKEIKERKEKIANLIRNLKQNDRNIYEAIIKKRKVLAAADDADPCIKNYRSQYANLIEIIADSESPQKTEAINKFFEAYNVVPWEVQLKCVKISLTMEDIKIFADWCNRQICLWQAGEASAYNKKAAEFSHTF
jgi:hypothetical protein